MAKQKLQKGMIEKKNTSKKLSAYQKERNADNDKPRSRKRTERENALLGLSSVTGYVRVPGENMRGKPQYKGRRVVV